MTDVTPFLSFVGALTLGAFVVVGAIVILRGAWAATVVVWGRRAAMDQAAEVDIIERLERMR